MEGIGGAVGYIDNALVLHIASITSANPAQVTTFHPHNLNTNDLIIVTDVKGMTKINRQIYSITPSTDNDFSFTLIIIQTQTELHPRRNGILIKGWTCH